MMRPLTKFTQTIVSGNNIPPLIREAFRISQEERPGAAHLELPEDIASEEISAEPLPRSRARRPIAEEKAVKHAVEMIENAKNLLKKEQHYPNTERRVHQALPYPFVY